MFKNVQSIADIQPFVYEKREIRFKSFPNGTTMASYLYKDSHTFDSPEARECRGILFSPEGPVCSRPLHKFFNIGESAELMPEVLKKRQDVVAIFKKLDGSMLATAWVSGQLQWRSMKVFDSDVVALTESFLVQQKAEHIQEFASKIASRNMTAIFEFLHPRARIVVDPVEPSLTLLHIRHNVTGEYVLLDKSHEAHALIEQYGIVRVQQLEGTSIAEQLDRLAGAIGEEGVIAQFSNGDMVKIKTPWYLRLHRSITFLRERDIARSALCGELDDLKVILREVDIDLTKVEKIEARVKDKLLEMTAEIANICEQDAQLTVKDFAQKYRKHPKFRLLMDKFKGLDGDLVKWYLQNNFRGDFSLEILADGALAEAIGG